MHGVQKSPWSPQECTESSQELCRTRENSLNPSGLLDLWWSALKQRVTNEADVTCVGGDGVRNSAGDGNRTPTSCVPDDRRLAHRSGFPDDGGGVRTCETARWRDGGAAQRKQCDEQREHAGATQGEAMHVQTDVDKFKARHGALRAFRGANLHVSA